MEEASAPALELSPASSGVPLLLSTSAGAGDSSESQTLPCGLGLETSKRARRVFKHSRHQSDQAGLGCGNLELGTDPTSGTSREGAARRITAEVASVSKGTENHAERKTSGHIPFRSPFEAHAHRDTDDCGSSTDDSSTAAGDTAQIEERASDIVVRMKQNAPSEPGTGASAERQSPLTGSSSSAEQGLATSEASGSTLWIKGDAGSSACSTGSPQGAYRASSGIAAAAAVSSGAEMEMISLSSKEQHDVTEVHRSLEEHAESELATRGRRSIPCRTPSEASLSRPKFSIRVYAGWLPPSLRTSPTGGWIKNGLTDRQMGSSEESNFTAQESTA